MEKGESWSRRGQSATIHAEAADAGYGGTLGLKEGLTGSPSLWAGQGFWAAADREHLIHLRELRAMRFLLKRHFADFVSRPDVQKVLLHEDNQAAVYILDTMVLAYPAMMVELLQLERLLKVLGVTIEDDGSGPPSITSGTLSLGHGICATRGLRSSS